MSSPILQSSEQLVCLLYECVLEPNFSSKNVIFEFYFYSLVLLLGFTEDPGGEEVHIIRAPLLGCQG